MQACIRAAAQKVINDPADVDGLAELMQLYRPALAGSWEMRSCLTFWSKSLYELQKHRQIFPGSISPEVAHFLYSLINVTRPETVLEIGTLYGYSCLTIGHALKSNGFGHLHSFDLFISENYKKLNETDGRAFVQRLLHQDDLSSFVTLHEGDSSTNIQSWTESVNARVDIAFIDGSHFITGVLKDFRVINPIMQEGGLMIFHDTHPDNSGWLGPRFLVEKLTQETDFAILDIKTADTLGLVIAQKTISEGSKASWRPSIKDLLVEQLLFTKHFRRPR